MEKVIKGLACCIKQGEQGILDCDSDCPYGEHGNRLDCWIKMNRDALALLKEQGTANVYKCPNCGTWVSAENVVRCKDCKYGNLWSDEQVIVCDKFSKTRDKNWFCADGERKEGR